MAKKKEEQVFTVSFMYQFDSSYYSTLDLKKTIADACDEAEKDVRKIDKKLSIHFEEIDSSISDETVAQKVKKTISASQLIIFEVSDNNTNVIYEYGYASSLDMVRILIKEKDSEYTPPSDIHGTYYFEYDKNNLKKLQLRIATEIRNLLKESDIGTDKEQAEDKQTGSGETPRIPRNWLLKGAFLEIHYDIRDDEETIIRDYIDCVKHKEIKEKFLYLGRAEARAWMNLCHDKLYYPFHASVTFLNSNIEKIINEVYGHCEEELDFICLGIGNGEKEHIILRSLLEKQNHVNFYPVDASKEMLFITLREFIDKLDVYQKRISFIGILGDFANLPKVQDIYNQATRNLFTMLGNTLGNYPENSLLSSIRDSMEIGDYLLVDSQLKPEDIDLKQAKEILLAGYDNDNYKRHVSSPLKKLGIDLGAVGKVKVQFSPYHHEDSNIDAYTLSHWFEFSKSAKVKVNGFSKEFKKNDKVKLGYSVKYTQKALIALLERYDFKVLNFFPSKDKFYGIALTQRIA